MNIHLDVVAMNVDVLVAVRPSSLLQLTDVDTFSSRQS